MGLIYLAAACYLMLGSCLSVAINTEEGVQVSTCCQDGQILKLERHTRQEGIALYAEYRAECVLSNRTESDILDTSTIAVDNSEKDFLIKKNGALLPYCPLGLMVHRIPVTESDKSGSTQSNPIPSKRVRLGEYRCGHANCQKGNVYVDDLAICHHEWGNKEAEVVCRELGFFKGEARQKSVFGYLRFANQTSKEIYQCSGNESSLLDCHHTKQENCTMYDIAGVECEDEKGLATPNPKPGCFDSETSYGGSYGKRARVYSAEQCQTKCQNDKRCNYFKWIDFTRPSGHSYNCYLMWSKDSYYTDRCTNCVSGPKHCNFGSISEHHSHKDTTCFKSQVFYVGDEVRSPFEKDNVSPGYCQEACQEEDGCNYFSVSDIFMGRGYCRFFTRTSMVGVNDASVSGQKFCGENEEDKEPYEWVKMEEDLPAGAFGVGKPWDYFTYLGRLEKDGETYLGKVQNRIASSYLNYDRYYGDNGTERRSYNQRSYYQRRSHYQTFSVLCVELDADVEWVQFVYENIPDNAVNCGIIDGEAHYAGRGTTHNKIIPGMFSPSEAKLKVLYAGSVHELDTFEVLVVKRNETRIEHLKYLQSKSANSTMEYEDSNDRESVDKLNISSSGQITVAWSKKLLPPTTYGAREYCLAGSLEGDLELKSNEAITLLCHPCKSKVMCAWSMEYYLQHYQNSEIGDINKDNKTNKTMISFEEYRNQMEEIVGLFFETQDENTDGFLDVDEQEDLLKNITMKDILYVFSNIDIEDNMGFKFLFYQYDQPEDCSLNVDELILNLEASGLPKHLEDMGKQVVFRISFAIKKFVSRADYDGDNRITLKELNELEDPSVVQSLVYATEISDKWDKAVWEMIEKNCEGYNKPVLAEVLKKVEKKSKSDLCR